jgi:8-oxo-dGTP diphosphatase
MTDGDNEEMMEGDYLKKGEIPPSFFRVSVKALVVREGKILLIEDLMESKSTWELPGGGLEFGETPHEAIRREVQEECGIEVVRIEEKPTYIIPVHRVNRRGLKEFHTLLICYRAEFASLDIRPSKECQKIQFFSKEEMGNIDLSVHSKEFIKHFNAADFSRDFEKVF